MSNKQIDCCLEAYLTKLELKINWKQNLRMISYGLITKSCDFRSVYVDNERAEVQPLERLHRISKIKQRNNETYFVSNRNIDLRCTWAARPVFDVFHYAYGAFLRCQIVNYKRSKRYACLNGAKDGRHSYVFHKNAFLMLGLQQKLRCTPPADNLTTVGRVASTLVLNWNCC